jgi:hypothetical protein
MVDALDAHDRELARALRPEEKLAQALELMSLGIQLKRATLQRRFPGLDEQGIQQLVTSWLTADD